MMAMVCISSCRKIALLGILTSLFTAVADANANFPEFIKLRAGVLHAPPFAIVEKNESFRGFQPDLLERLVLFAAKDNVTLSFELEPAPPQYGPALDLVANDCNTSANPNPKNDCERYDLIVGDYYTNPDRALRIDFTPSWLSTTMSVIKFTQKNQTVDYTTLTEVQRAGGIVCVPDGTYLMTVVMGKFPDAEYNKCPTASDCLEELKAERCSLYVDDELQLRYRATLDTSLEVTREKFNTQYLTWPMSYILDPMVSLLMKRWIYAAVSDTTLDQLYSKYFQKMLCPVGTAGKNCELPCDPNHGTSNSDGDCVCSSAKWTGNDCSVEVLEERNLIQPTLKAVAYAMFGLNVAVIIGCATWLYLKRKTPQVQVAQPLFLLLVLIGCFISSSSIIALAEDDDGTSGENTPHADAVCAAVPWLYGVGFAITFGTLFAKIRRVYIIFISAAECRRQTVSNLETLTVVCSIVLVYVVLLTVWTIVDPLNWQRTVVQSDIYGVPLESEGHCTSDHWIIWASIFITLNLVVMTVACVLCYKSRSIPTKFSEGKYLTIAMVSNLQIFVLGVPVLIILGDEPQTSFFMKSVIVWMNDLVVVALIFGNLIWSVHTTQGDTVGSSENNVSDFVSRGMNEYRSKSMRRSSVISQPSSRSLMMSNTSIREEELIESSDNDNSVRREEQVENKKTESTQSVVEAKGFENQ